MVWLSVIIPSVNDPALANTVREVQEKSRTHPEIIVMADAVDVKLTGVIVVRNSKRLGLRNNVNNGMMLASGEWLVKLDDHCMLFDYERLDIGHPDKIGGVTWRSRRKERENVFLDETMVIQGSFYLMHRDHWSRIGPLDEVNYGPFTQEGIEVALKT